MSWNHKSCNHLILNCCKWNLWGGNYNFFFRFLHFFNQNILYSITFDMLSWKVSFHVVSELDVCCVQWFPIWISRVAFPIIWLGHKVQQQHYLLPLDCFNIIVFYYLEIITVVVKKLTKNKKALIFKKMFCNYLRIGYTFKYAVLSKYCI